jgi:hypothetical protein
MMLDLAFNEVEGMTLKAARGLGASWGLAEEAGRACGWLARHGLPFAQPLLALEEAGALAGLPPACGSGTLVHAAPVSGLVAGAALVDRPEIANWRLGEVVGPLMLLPFLAFRGGGRIVLPDPMSLADLARCAVEIGPGALAGWPVSRRARVDERDWDRLAAIAQRTYVPASAQSRATGAGAGLTDND